MANRERPLSPHLQVYRPQLTSVLSISHRVTGVVNAVGAALFVLWLVAAASGPERFANAMSIVGSVPGRILMFAWTYTVLYHLCNGIRHLFWDAGKGFELKTAYASGWTVVGVSIVLTLLVWVAALSGGGS